MQKNVPAIVAVFLGVIAVSFASIFIRFIEVAPIIIAFYRLFVTTLILTPVFLLKETQRGSIRKYPFYYILSGVFLAFHFYLWIASLSYTSVSSSVILVSLHPIIVAVYSHFILKEKISLPTLVGILIAIVGVIIISAGDHSQGSNVLLGDLLALGGAVMMAGYLLVGRKLRQEVSTINYTFWVYGIASLVLLVLALALKAPLYPYSVNVYFIFLLLAVIPTLMGHSVFNWALDKVPVALVSLIILGEPVGATILAWLFLNEPPTLFHYIGGLFILAGLFLTVRKALKD
jgi:drug/metabolite transporter (DMT)-like permease